MFLMNEKRLSDVAVVEGYLVYYDVQIVNNLNINCELHPRGTIV